MGSSAGTWVNHKRLEHISNDMGSSAGTSANHKRQNHIISNNVSLPVELNENDLITLGQDYSDTVSSKIDISPSDSQES
jgi:pSer/pThr/pTyr-binding forkhead associated (FHA) protein